ncbi:hypothetical protein ABVK25_012032 [Lepraria finkii]|uniref:Rhodopsin domain-containing protein n=1 Tax=Lepraria finkii TaxID=1340010 RepID=A0ABR4AM96_9LECA
MPPLTHSQLAHYHESKQPSIIATSVIFLFICNASVVLRVFSQLRLSGRLFVDDYAIIFAAICSDITGALYLNATAEGLGLHIYRSVAEDPNPPQHLISLFRALYINAVFTGPCFAGIKISLLWYYRRTFLVHQKWLYIAWWINLVYIVLWTIGSTLFYMVQCLPPDYYWKRLYHLLKIPPPSPIHGQCNSATPTLVALPLIFSLISDIGVLLLPVVTLARLHTRMRRKIGLMIIFSLGALACVCEIVRIWLEVTVSAFEDPTYDNVSFVIFTFAEGNIAIAAACAPLLASQWNWTLQKIRSSKDSQSSISNFALKQNDAPSSQERSSGSYPQGSQNHSVNTLPAGSGRNFDVERLEYERMMAEKTSGLVTRRGLTED